MRGDGLSFPVNPDAGGESASLDWAGTVARDEGHGNGVQSNGFASDERLRAARNHDDGEMV